ncbi:MAG: O-antigen ligase family protein [Syntrophobacterales bacterium]|nr:O-antigen ligase family protein [Syntrophobacterales bacterium]
MIASSLFALGLILVPFNDLPLFGGLFGELSVEGTFLPLFLLVIFFFFRENFSFYLPRTRSVHFLLLFLAAVLISGMVNSPQILEAQFMGRTGPSKYILQLAVLLFGVSLAITSFNLMQLRIIGMQDIRRLLCISFILAGSYSIIEVIHHLGFPWAEALLEAINPLLHTEEAGLLYTGKVRSVTGEPSFFGMYGALLLPWLVSYLFTEKRRWPFALLTLYLVFLMLLSLSRLAYGMLLLETLLLFYFIFRARVMSLSGTTIALTLLAVTVTASIYAIQRMAEADVELLRQGVVLSLASEENLSNICRYGTQVAAVHMGLDHPLLGTGLGQFPFYMEKYLPTWSMVSPEIREYLHGVGLPRVHGMYARIFSEAGAVGLILWLAFVGALLWETWRTVRRSFATLPDWLGVALVVNLVALASFGLTTATFRKLEMWVLFGVAWAYNLLGPHPPRRGESV